MYSTASWAGNEGKRLHSELKKIDANGLPRHYARRYTDEPTDAESNLGLLRLGHDVSNQWRYELLDSRYFEVSRLRARYNHEG